MTARARLVLALLLAVPLLGWLSGGGDAPRVAVVRTPRFRRGHGLSLTATHSASS